MTLNNKLGPTVPVASSGMAIPTGQVLALLFLAMLAAVQTVGGCSDKYARKDVSDSAEAEQVRAMTAELRAAKKDDLPSVIARQQADGLTDVQSAGLKASLELLAAADEVKLASVDKFGDDVFRAVFTVAEQGQATNVVFLLVRSKGTMKWAGRN